MSDSKDTQGDHNKKRRTVNLVWRPVSTQANSIEEGGQLQEVQASVSSDVLTDHNDEKLPGEESEVEGLHAVISSKLSRDDHLMEALNEMSVDNICSSSLEKDIDDKPLDTESVSNGNHSLSIEVGASLIRFIRGKEGSTQNKIEEELGVKITVPSSNKEDSVVIEGDSIDSVTRASEKIQHIIDEAVNSPKLEYSHFVSLPLAVHPELVDKLVNFQNCILGNNESGLDESKESDSNEDVSDDESKDQDLEGERVAVQLQVKDDEKHVKVDVTNIPLVSYAPKASKSSSISLANLGIEKSIFIKPKTFHLTVLMLKLWNKERVNRAAEVLQTVSSKVLDALDRRPISIRLKGLDCMRGSLAKARVVYAPVEEVGSEDRLLHACQIIINAFVEAGLVLEKDANQKLKLHATVMNARHRKRKTRSRKFDSFDARGIFKQFGSEEWGEYLIREAHLSQRFKYDENGYYHCCASIPFPEEMQFD